MPNPIDSHVGSRIRMRRNMLGMSQERLAHQLGITFQQVQKYENASNRVGASRLYDIARVLTVPVSYMYEGFEQAENQKFNVSEDAVNFDEKLRSKETLELIKSYYAIKDEAVRRSVYEMMKSLSKTEK